jgi:hypothetical protein
VVHIRLSYHLKTMKINFKCLKRHVFLWIITNYQYIFTFSKIGVDWGVIHPYLAWGGEPIPLRPVKAKNKKIKNKKNCWALGDHPVATTKDPDPLHFKGNGEEPVPYFTGVECLFYFIESFYHCRKENRLLFISFEVNRIFLPHKGSTL